jgi:hypothetical protein
MREKQNDFDESERWKGTIESLKRRKHIQVTSSAPMGDAETPTLGLKMTKVCMVLMVIMITDQSRPLRCD